MYSQKYLRGSLSNLVKPMASIVSALSSASIVMPNRYPLYGTRMFPKASWCLQQNPGPIQAKRGMRDHQPRTQTTSTSDFWPRPFQPPPENTTKTQKVRVTTIFCFCSPSCKSTFPLETLSLLRLFSPLNHALATVGVPCVPSPFRPYLKHRFSQVGGMMVHLLSMPFAVCLLGNTLIKPTFSRLP